MSSRKRIDYKILNSTGEVVPLDENISTRFGSLSIKDTSPDTSINMVLEGPSEDAIDLKLMAQEIVDFVDENPMTGMGTDELNQSITRLQELRSSIRRKEVNVSSAKEEISEDIRISINHAVLMVKEFIKEANDMKSKTRLREERTKHDESFHKERAVAFLLECTNESMNVLEETFSRNITKADSNNLLNWRKEETLINKKFGKVRDDFKECLEAQIINPDLLSDIKDVGERYTSLEKLRQKFTKELASQIDQRELDKHAEFAKSKLNIKIEKFSGYDATTDFYTFRSNFEKMHLSSTPKELLPDLLRNNYLTDPARTMVKSLITIDEVWRRLRESFGDPRMMMSRRLQQLKNLDLNKKDPEKLISGISSLISIMKEVSSLAEKHHVEEHLYYGDSMARINQLIGDRRSTKFITHICDEDLTPKQKWFRLIDFLTKERRVNEQKQLLTTFDQTQKTKEDSNKQIKRNNASSFHTTLPLSSEVSCSICSAPDGSDDHTSTNGPKGCKILQYYTCKDFVTKSPAERFNLLKNKGFCIQCLFPGADASSGKHAEGRCQRDFTCSHPSHNKYPVKKHVLLCEEHKSSDINKDLLQKFVQRFIRNPLLPDFSRQISLYKTSNKLCNDRGIYLLQEVCVDNKNLLIFYDNGCSDFVITKKAVDLLGSRVKQISTQSVTLGGVGNSTTQSLNGIYTVKLPLHNGTEITLTGACLSKITETLPTYPLQDVEKDINKAHKSSGGTCKLPKLPASIGGDVHMMIGIKYLRYHPTIKFQTSTGLTIYESKFNNTTGGRGVVGGPHKVFTSIHQLSQSTFLTDQLSSLRDRQPISLLGFKAHPIKNLYHQYEESCSPTSQVHITSTMRVFEEVDATGSEISYRCPQCRTCKACKHEATNDIISVKEEIEQSIINSSVKIDLQTATSTALLPFIADPTTRLANNKEKALKIYHQQIRKLNRPENKKDKQDVLDSEGKLHQLGYVDFVQNLSPAIQSSLKSSKTQYYIPWRAVWKGNSVSTPCRVVFDASQPTSTGFSLNDVIAKGRNNLNKLQEVFLRWLVQPVGIATDIRKMYNTIRLDEQHWCYQRYLWQKDLDASKQPEEKIIKTLIYGVKSSGNQAEYALRKVAEMSKDEFPKINTIIQEDVYVDDCLTGEISHEEAHRTFDELEVVLNRGGFLLKGVAFSGCDPPSSLSDDGETIFVAGMKWFVKSDELSLNIGELNFAKKHRGKKSIHSKDVIPSRLTRRHCASKVAEVYDLSGKVSPLIASMKIDLQQLVHRQLDWDDAIPDDLRQIWEGNFELIKEIGTLKFRRAVVPEDAVNLDMNTLDFGDASHSMACIAIYVRFLRRNGEFSCQLLFSRTRTVPKDHSQPRGELYAALINSHTGETVRRSISKWHKSSIKLTDSQIVLHWIDNEEKPLKQWVRNRVVDIKRFTEKQQWYFVDTENMIADIGTRKGATIQSVNDDSAWINGLNWMRKNQSKFPIKSAGQLKLNETEISEVHKESHIQVHHTTFQPNETQARYKFSKYLVDPNHRSFTKSVCILGYVLRFCNHLLKKTKPTDPKQLSQDEISTAERYYYQKATSEVIQFLQPRKYEPISTLKDNLLIYNGRILQDDKVTIVGRFTDAMLDLSSSTFCVPIMDRNSPIAFSIVRDIHWNDPVYQHSGVESTLRQVLKKVFIIEGRSLVKMIKKSCAKCRYINKKTIEAIMGPLPKTSFTIAPAFYSTQLDLSGPYKSYSPAHKRTTVKVWLVVYCCCSTSAVMINVMDDYSSPAFIQAFTRFSARHGFPKKVFCDEGSQLIKGTKDMTLSYTNIKSRLFKEQNVDFQTCPVGGHNVNGRVERKIKEVNLSLEKFINNQRLSILQWETMSAVIANTINNLPLAVGNVTDCENMDLLTPNRLLLGRNNERGPSGEFVVSKNPTQMIKENTKIYDAWFESWLVNHVPKLMKQTKWFRHENLHVGDVVLFKKVDSIISRNYTFGRVIDVIPGADGNVRQVRVEYQNENEIGKRETTRSVRSLVLIHSIEDVNVEEEMFKMANEFC